LNGRNTSLEDPDVLVQSLSRIMDSSNPAKLWITPNTATEYRGWTHAHNKLSILREVLMRLE